MHINKASSSCKILVRYCDLYVFMSQYSTISGKIKQKLYTMQPSQCRAVRPLSSKKSAVVVDDDIDIITVLKNGLEQNNYEVHAFANPLKAVEYLKSVGSPQILITDLRMPGMTGFELVREVRKHHPDMGIIVTTAFDVNKSEFEKVLLSTKIDALINKPISIRKLIDAANAIYVSKR